MQVKTIYVDESGSDSASFESRQVRMICTFVLRISEH